MTRFARVAATAGLTLAALFLAAPPAGAAEIGVDEAISELDRSRSLIDESVELYERGNASAAYDAALSSYLDHFEYVEIPLRVRNETLTLQLEEDFANLRNLIEAGAPAEDIETVAGETLRGLDTVERELDEPGTAAPLIAAMSSFIILFREGLEAVLVVAAILGYLEASRNAQYRAPVLRGIGAAVVATIVLFVAASWFFEIAPVQRELLEAGTAVVAVAMLFYVSFWLVARLEQRRWMEFVKAKVWTAATTGSALALAGVGFTAVFREGFETVLFYQALSTFATGMGQWVAAGAGVAVVVLAAVGFAIFKAGRKVPLKMFLTGAVILVMAISVAFAGNAVRALQQAAMFPITFLEDWPQLPIFLADLTGWHPTQESLVAQGALTLVYVLGGVWTFGIAPRRERAALRREPTVPSEV